MTTYRIINPHGKNGPAWKRDYETKDAAAEAIRDSYGWDEIVLSASFADDDHEDGSSGNACAAYETKADCDKDGDGSRAPWITW